jgi:predicted transcriptional regulator
VGRFGRRPHAHDTQPLLPAAPDQVIVTPEIGESLRAARTARGIDVRALSRLVGVSGSTISQMELGNVMPTVATYRAPRPHSGSSRDSPA